jgi:hypothetical protein
VLIVDGTVDAVGDNELFNMIDCLRTFRFVALLLLLKSFSLLIGDDDDEGDEEQDDKKLQLLLLLFNEVGDLSVKIGLSLRIVAVWF